MMTVKDVCNLARVTARTLHYYDEIGLLRPCSVTSANYRLYGNEELERLQQILFFRELDFSLDEIKRILDSPDFDRDEALRKQENLLILKCKRLNNLIELIRDIRNKEMNTMSFSQFDTSEIDQYAQKAKQRWGKTDAYKESQKRSAGYTQQDWERINRGMVDCFAGFAALKDGSPDSPEAQQQVHKLRNLISENFYNCNKEILKSLGEMYSSDERFRKNIDESGEGTAEFASRAIAVYCKD